VARIFTKSTDYLSSTTVAVSSYPFSVYARVKTTDLSSTQQPIFFISHATNTDTTSGIWLRPDLSPQSVALRTTVAGSGVTVTAGTIVSNTWLTILAVFDTSYRALYVDNLAVQTNTGTFSFDTYNRTTIGALIRSSGTTVANATIEDIAVWSGRLDPNHKYAIDQGQPIENILPANQLAYYKLKRSAAPEIDLVGTNDLTVTGTCATATGMSRTSPRRRRRLR
jgi:hypothetical protein